MSKTSAETLREMESMDGDDERSDRSASPRALVLKHGRQEAVVTHKARKAGSCQQPTTLTTATQTRRSTRATTMAVEIEMIAPQAQPQPGSEHKQHHHHQHHHHRHHHHHAHAKKQSNNGDQVLRSVHDQDNQESTIENDKSKKRRRPRRKNRKWKPYTLLSWEERQQRDEEESRRASLKRSNRHTPYNTTQFLMEDHKVETPDLSSMGAYDENHEIMSSSDEIFENENNDDEYMVRNFTAVYDEVQLERLQQMSKEQLVNEVLELSKKVSELEETIRPSSGSGGGKEDGRQSSGSGDEPPKEEDTISRQDSNTSVHELEETVKQLKEENRQLRTRRSVQQKE